MINKTIQTHSFHIPVMGLAFTIDSPIKVAKYGISSVVSIVDDALIERMNKYYSNKFKLPYIKHDIDDEDYRAKRITAYLNLLDTITQKSFLELKKSYAKKNSEFEKYLDMIPYLKKQYFEVVKTKPSEIEKWIEEKLKIGSIDVNIMTKLDKVNYKNKERLPTEYNDAHAALRGFANSTISSSVVLSAGMNPRLYSYFENFDVFFPKENGYLKKKIVLKVSDYRSAIIQGKFLAKKGLWVSEYRVESGLNCGGHAFATEGVLMGPILEDFKKNKAQLVDEVFEILVNALKSKGKEYPKEALNLKITVQGGIGTAAEHNFLLNKYNVDSIGWGSPFLLVPEATTVDKPTINLLKKAKEKDLYLSGISPIGIPFNTLRGNSNEILKNKRIKAHKPGSVCPKVFLVSNKDYTEKAICTGSITYQKKRIAELKKENLSKEEYDKKYFKITEKACLCEGLANSAIIEYGIAKKVKQEHGVAICPGPNMAYYSQEATLKDMVYHINGKKDLVSSKKRPHVFIKELKMYVDYLEEKVEELEGKEINRKQDKYFKHFRNNLREGMAYYHRLFSNFELNSEKLMTEIEIIFRTFSFIKIPKISK